MRRKLVAIIPILLLALLAPGCGKRETKLAAVRADIRKTRAEATKFVYTDERASGTIRVAGVFDDDFRYKALVSFDGKPAYEQIVADDTLAIRFLDPDKIGQLADVEHISTADRSTDLDGIDTIKALQSGRWVVDTNGAPPVAAFGASLKDIGKDPVFDALTALGYVDRALTEAQSVDEWKSDAIDPAYRSSEDTFPKPAGGSQVKRYDLRRPRLPAASSGAGNAGIGNALPTTRHFRKMAIYAKGGRVLRVLERIEVVGKSVDDLSGYYTSMLKESKAPKALVAQAEAKLKAGGQSAETGRFLLDGLGRALGAVGDDPLLVRNMSLELDRSGDRIAVTLPTDNVVKGNLDVLLASAAAKKAAATATSGDKQPSADTTTTAPEAAPTSAP